MSHQLTIRFASKANAIDVFELILSSASVCMREEFDSFASTVSVDTIQELIENPQYLYTLGFYGDELVGVAAMREMKHFYHLFISPKHLQQGIAKRLWNYLKLEAIAYGTKILTVNSSLYAVPVYKKFGFVPTGEAQSKKGINFVPMQLLISD